MYNFGKHKDNSKNSVNDIKPTCWRQVTHEFRPKLEGPKKHKKMEGWCYANQTILYLALGGLGQPVRSSVQWSGLKNLHR